MDIKELKKQEQGLLTSYNSNLKEYGRAYKAIIDKYNKYSGKCLSDDILISDLAKEYISEQKREMNFVKDKEPYFQRINGASKLIISHYASETQVRAILDDEKPKTFEDAHNILKLSYLYKKIRPEMVENIISTYYN